VLQSGSAVSLDPDIQESIEMWMLLEYADKGNLEQAIQQQRFAARGNPGQLDMVSVQRVLLSFPPPFWLDRQRGCSVTCNKGCGPGSSTEGVPQLLPSVLAVEAHAMI
jgi:hypothetical protein